MAESLIFAAQYYIFNIDKNGAVAQLVEQRTENPCVGGSIPPHTTKALTMMLGFFYVNIIYCLFIDQFLKASVLRGYSNVTENPCAVPIATGAHTTKTLTMMLGFLFYIYCQGFFRNTHPKKYDNEKS